MTRRKHLAQRRAKNQQLGKQDAMNRCAFCKRELPAMGAIEAWPDWPTAEAVKYCSSSCAADADEARLTMEASR